MSLRSLFHKLVSTVSEPAGFNITVVAVNGADKSNWIKLLYTVQEYVMKWLFLGAIILWISKICSEMFYSVLTCWGSCLNNSSYIILALAQFLLSHDLSSPYEEAHTDTGPHTPWHSGGCVAWIKVHQQWGAQNVTDVFVLISALLLLSFRLSIHCQLVPVSPQVYPSVTIPTPIKQAYLSLSTISCFLQSKYVSFTQISPLNAQEILFHGWTNLEPWVL